VGKVRHGLLGKKGSVMKEGEIENCEHDNLDVANACPPPHTPVNGEETYQMKTTKHSTLIHPFSSGFSQRSCNIVTSVGIWNPSRDFMPSFVKEQVSFSLRQAQH